MQGQSGCGASHPSPEKILPQRSQRKRCLFLGRPKAASEKRISCREPAGRGERNEPHGSRKELERYGSPTQKAVNCHCEGASPRQSPVGWASRPSSFPRTRESRLDPGSESGVTNHRQSRVPRGTVPPMRLLRRLAPRNDIVRRVCRWTLVELSSEFQPAPLWQVGRAVPDPFGCHGPLYRLN